MAMDMLLPQLVVVGSSAGGIEALSVLVSTLPRDFPAPLVIAQHLDPQRPSHLGEILARQSTLPVTTILDHEALTPGHIFVVPSDRHVEITDGHLSLRQHAAGRPKPSINLLFGTAALSYGERLIAVILTGSGSDGATGALEVKRAGGTVVIQNPATASYPSMPQSLAPTTVDLVANIEDIGPLLADLLTGTSLLTQPRETRALRDFLLQVHEHSGLDFTSYKPATILRRIKRRMVATSTGSLEDYLDYLRRYPEEYQRLVTALLIKVTEFFRDSELYATLRAQIVPDILENARRTTQELRIWSAGCATGEEAYSLALLVAEALGDDLGSISVRIFATDLDNEALAFARRGIYPGAALVDVPPELVERYFTRLDGDYEISKAVRSMVVFGQHDLGQRAPFPHIDLLLCRNVLIYFTTELQRHVLQLFAYSLRNGGYLVLGKTETNNPLANYFIPENAGLRIYRRDGERLMMPARQIVKPREWPLAIPRNLVSTTTRQPTPRAMTDRVRTSAERIGEAVLDLPMGIVVIDRRYDVQLINAAAIHLLSIRHSAIGEDLLHLSKGFDTRLLREAIDTTLRGEPAPLTPLVLEAVLETGETTYMQIDCYPKAAPNASPSQNGPPPIEQVVLVIADVTQKTLDRHDTEQRAADGIALRRSLLTMESLVQADSAASQHEEIALLKAQVERLTRSTRELRDANDELTRTNLDLRQANEEFQMTTEELQAATEEVETLNEELQATNEELETLNEELQATVEELNTSNDDLEARSIELQATAVSLEEQRHTLETERTWLSAILVSMSDAVLAVDVQGQSLLTNAAYAQMFGSSNATILPEDEQGQPFPIETAPQRRAARGESFSMSFTLKMPDGTRHWFEANGQPIFQSKRPGEIGGGVVVIRDITDRSMRKLQDEFLTQANHELRTPLTAAQAALQMLRKMKPATEFSSERVQHHIAIALRQVQRIGALVGDLADVGRLQSGTLQIQHSPVDLGIVVSSAVDAARLIVAEGQEITLTPPPPTPLMVLGDSLRLEQVMLNLLANAIKYAPYSERIEVCLRQDGAIAEVQVQDQGPGIPKRDLPYLFQRFYQVTASGETQHGLGLGLFIVKEMVEAQGGTVGVESRLGDGATFTVRLPLLTDEAEAHSSPAATSEGEREAEGGGNDAGQRRGRQEEQRQ